MLNVKSISRQNSKICCQHMFSTRGFTLVELLIVVLIIAVLAAVSVPKFMNSASDTQHAALDHNLKLIRNAIDRYKVEHRRWPGKLTSMGGSCPSGGSGGSGLVNSAQALLDQLTNYSDENGITCSTTDSTYRFGPYLRDTEIPSNPISGSNTVVISTTGTLGLTSAKTDLSGGWLYDVWTGEMVADDSAYDHR